MEEQMLKFELIIFWQKNKNFQLLISATLRSVSSFSNAGINNENFLKVCDSVWNYGRFTGFAGSARRATEKSFHIAKYSTPEDFKSWKQKFFEMKSYGCKILRIHLLIQFRM